MVSNNTEAPWGRLSLGKDSDDKRRLTRGLGGSIRTVFVLSWQPQGWGEGRAEDGSGVSSGGDRMSIHHRQTEKCCTSDVILRAANRQEMT